MSIQNIHLINFRNIENSTTQLSPSFNFLYGDNGSGKTSYLEAIYALSCGRSFRSRSAHSMISHKMGSLKIDASVTLPDNPQLSLDICMQRSMDSKTLLEVSGQKASSFVESARLLPILFIGVDTNLLFNSGATYRRKFIDWGVFHVEHQFYTHWSRYNKNLRHRNYLLKKQPLRSDLMNWDLGLVEAAAYLDTYRKEYCSRLQKHLQPMWAEYGFPGSLEFRYSRGWAHDRSLMQVLDSSYHNDLKYRYTCHGAHKADLAFYCDDCAVKDVLSQGQQKMLSYMLRISQGLLMFEDRGTSPIYLIDDLPSELDAKRILNLLKILGSLQGQVFITAIENDIFYHLAPSFSERKMFHVEHGDIKEANYNEREINSNR